MGWGLNLIKWFSHNHIYLRAYIPLTNRIILLNTTTYAIISAKKRIQYYTNNSISCSNCKSWNPKMRNWNPRIAHSRALYQSWRVRPARQFQPHLVRSTESSPRWCVCVSLMSPWTQVLFAMFNSKWACFLSLLSPTTWVLGCVFCTSKSFFLRFPWHPVHADLCLTYLFPGRFFFGRTCYICPLTFGWFINIKMWNQQLICYGRHPQKTV